MALIDFPKKSAKTFIPHVHVSSKWSIEGVEANFSKIRKKKKKKPGKSAVRADDFLFSRRAFCAPPENKRGVNACTQRFNGHAG